MRPVSSPTRRPRSIRNDWAGRQDGSTPTSCKRSTRRSRSCSGFDLEHKSMGQVASELLARALRERDRGSTESPFRWTHRDLGVPRVDLEDKEAVRAILDRA
ncbi:MAG TPA: hypothetical protein VF895_05615 [Gaiellaceae bacterium]